MSEYELTDRAKRVLLRLSVVLYVVSLFLPTGAGVGMLCLLMGWFEVVSSPVEGIAWIANPLVLLTWLYVSMRRGNVARTLSVFALVLGGSWMFQHRAITDEGGIPGNVPLSVGYWIWLLSLMLAALSAFFGVRDRPATEA